MSEPLELHFVIDDATVVYTRPHERSPWRVVLVRADKTEQELHISLPAEHHPNIPHAAQLYSDWLATQEK